MKQQFTTESGVLSLLNAAASGRRDEGYKYFLKGDLCSMSEQKRFLEDNGFNLGQVDVYPALKTEEEYLDAVRLLWENKIQGWWNYRKEIVEKLKLCTIEEFRKKL